jgi:hypothetical protein
LDAGRSRCVKRRQELKLLHLAVVKQADDEYAAANVAQYHWKDPVKASGERQHAGDDHGPFLAAASNTMGKAQTSGAGFQKKERFLLKSECLINVLLPPSHHDEHSDANAGME